MLEKLTKLIDVKSIMTLTLTGAFVWLVGTNVVDGKEFMTIYAVIVAFYFGTQSNKTNV